MPLVVSKSPKAKLKAGVLDIDEGIKDFKISPSMTNRAMRAPTDRVDKIVFSKRSKPDCLSDALGGFNKVGALGSILQNTIPFMTQAIS